MSRDESYRLFQTATAQGDVRRGVSDRLPGSVKIPRLVNSQDLPAAIHWSVVGVSPPLIIVIYSVANIYQLFGPRLFALRKLPRGEFEGMFVILAGPREGGVG